MFSEEIRDTVNHLNEIGKSYTEIASLLNISRNSVKSLILYKKKPQKAKSGPKRKVTDAMRLRIKRTCERLIDEGCKVNCNIIRSELDLDISRRTLNNFFLKSEYLYSKIRHKLPLTNKHKLKRLELVSDWIHKNINWNLVVFTDEKRFSLDGSDSE